MCNLHGCMGASAGVIPREDCDRINTKQWDDQDRHVEELIALTEDYRVAKAAFDQAVKARPGRIITLRQKARLIADSRGERRS